MASRFANLAKRANEANNNVESERTFYLPPSAVTLPVPQPIHRPNSKTEPPNENFKQRAIEKNQIHGETNALQTAFFVPSNIHGTNKLQNNNLSRRMTRFSRLDSYIKKNSSEPSSKPLLETDNSLESECSSIFGSRNSSNMTETSTIDSKPSGYTNPLIRQANVFEKASSVTDNNRLKDKNPENSSVGNSRRGAVVDTVQAENGNLRLKMMKSRLRKIVDERLSVKQIFSRYVKSSTLHGFVYTCSDTYIIRRVIWACLMILGAIYFLIKLEEGIVEYFEYPITTLATMDLLKEIPFPAISFCLLNSYDTAALKKSQLSPLLHQKRFPINLNWSDPDYDIPGDELEKQLKTISLGIEDIFEECDWIKRHTDHPHIEPNVCDATNYTTYFNSKGQICFTLNSGKENHRLLSVTHEGTQYGYDVTFDIKTPDALRVHPYVGISVILHSQDEPPCMESGFLLSPGFSHYVRMTMIETINLPPPYDTQCGELKLKYFENYNQKACLLEKLTDYVGRKCGCREPFMPKNGLKICSLKETITCSFVARESFDEYEERKSCPIDCNKIHFAHDTTSARFLHNPPKGIQPEILKQQLLMNGKNKSHLLELTEKLTTEELDHYVEDNLVKVIFYYGDMSKDIYEQEATFDFYQFLGDMGGEIGLMLGASLLTFVEFIDLIIFLIYHQLLRLSKRTKVEDAEEEEESL